MTKKHFNVLLDAVRRHGYRLRLDQLKSLERVGKNLQRKAEQACNYPMNDRQIKLANTYIKKQLRKAEDILVSIGAENDDGHYVEYNPDPRGFSLKIRGLKSKSFNGAFVSNSVFEPDVLGF